jgi:hypothetical protein
MITDAMKLIDHLDFENTRTEAALDLGVRKFRTWNANDGLDFQIGISGNGFEASRNLNRDELISIRDWINEALQASEVEIA